MRWMHPLIREQFSIRDDDPLLPDLPEVDGIGLADHVTFVTSPAYEEDFLAARMREGFATRTQYTTRRFPARHIALAAAATADTAAEVPAPSLGLSVSDDLGSPINKCVHLYGGHRLSADAELLPGRVQHFALCVDPERLIEVVRTKLESHGVKFMTPILCNTDPSGAFLKQMFVACKVPFGPFVEIIQRGRGRNGEIFRGFNIAQIDDLYEHYDRFSRAMRS